MAVVMASLSACAALVKPKCDGRFEWPFGSSVHARSPHVFVVLEHMVALACGWPRGVVAAAHSDVVVVVAALDSLADVFADGALAAAV